MSLLHRIGAEHATGFVNNVIDLVDKLDDHGRLMRTFREVTEPR